MRLQGPSFMCIPTQINKKGVFFVIVFHVLVFWPLFTNAGKKSDVFVDGSDASNKLFAKAKSCTPVLLWRNVRKDGENLTYDVAIHIALKSKGDSLPGLGEQVFYEEKISSNTINVTKKLNPNTKYLWSFRLRREDDQVTGWYKHNTKGQFFSGTHYWNIWFGFKTPTKCL